LRPELRAIWDEYAAAVAEHDGWPIGAVYMRESKREQVEGFSPSAQLKGTLENARQRQLWIPAEHVFLDAISGRREERPAFGELLAIARAGRIGTVLVLHTSRWARNALISRRWKDELRGRGVDVVALNAPFDIARPEGKFAERMMEAVDEFTSDTIGFWVRVGLREKHEQGHPLGRLPETFLAVQTGTTAKGSPVYAYEPHPELSAIVLEGARRYLAGDVGFGELAQWGQREGYRTPAGRALTDEWWRNTLTNPLNAGYVAYRRKRARTRGGAELRKAALDGFMPLEMYEALQETRRRRTRTAGHAPRFEVYVLSGATCGACGGRVTASTKRRLRCRIASEHAGCVEPSVAARPLEEQFGEWLADAVALPASERTRLAALVRAKLRRGSDTGKATRLRAAIKRLTDAFTWGGLEEAEYRQQLADLRAQLERTERVPDERRILEAVRIAQDIPRAWALATNDQRRRMVWATFEWIRVSEGKVVAVRPRPETAPLLALRVHSRGPDRIRTGDLVLDRDVC
jgi:DNA invertase Pin-like site-specific DNA recombinase